MNHTRADMLFELLRYCHARKSILKKNIKRDKHAKFIKWVERMSNLQRKNHYMLQKSGQQYLRNYRSRKKWVLHFLMDNTNCMELDRYQTNFY